jgi:hypothetical protein
VKPISLVLLSSEFLELLETVDNFFVNGLRVPPDFEDPSKFCEKPTFVVLSDRKLSKEQTAIVEKYKVFRVFRKDLGKDELADFD